MFAKLPSLIIKNSATIAKLSQKTPATNMINLVQKKIKSKLTKWQNKMLFSLKTGILGSYATTLGQLAKSHYMQKLRQYAKR